MGKRGPGAARLREAARGAPHPAPAGAGPLFGDVVPFQPATARHPWEQDGMPPEEQVLAFLRALPIVSGLRAGERMELLEFQERFVRCVYGPLDAEGQRLVRLAALSVARGNGKSAVLAGLSLAHLLGPMVEPYGECYAAALDREQAGVLYRMTRAYVEQVPWMAARVNIRDWHKEIIDERSNSLWRALTSDARKAHGLAPSFWIADEVAQWRSRELWDNLATGMGKRASALGVTISTQAADDLHFFSEMLDAEPVPSVYVQLHAAPEGCALDDRAAWAAANPALGAFLNLDQFADAAARAMRSPSFEPSFRLLQLNQRIDAEARFLNAADWEANGEPFDPAELEGERCYGGLDLSSTRDLTALALWFPAKGKLLAWHFVPGDTIGERVERDRVPYDRWADAGWIETTNGRATDRVAIARRLADIRQCYDVAGIAFDRWRFEDLAKLLSDEGIDLPMSEFVPGFKSYAAAVDAFERAVLERRMRHNGSPILKWQAGNVIIEQDAAGNRKPSKAKSIDKIDGIVAAIMACGLAATDEGPKVYRGIGLEWV
ncbi:terminase large subunit [Sphingomonas flavalba]|uniref:terminase large subunit n=1 Tax=Sphingomonas flavalba TaxID=2559804 RepID=UPI0039E1A7F6